MRIHELLESKTKKAEAPKPRNFVAKNAKMGGAGAHKDKKKAAKQGDAKHKNKDLEVAEDLRTENPCWKGYHPVGTKKKGGKTVPNCVPESATAGSTSAGNVAVGAVYPNKKGKTFTNKDGTAKNALDVKGANLMTGGSIKR
jgi:hypothetical protein